MSSDKLLLTAFFLSFSGFLTDGQLDFDISQHFVKITSVDCCMNPELVVNVSCSLKAISWESSYLNMSADTMKPFTNFSVNVQVLRRETHYLPFLINVTRNVCDLFIKKKGSDFYGKMLKDTSSLFNIKGCPIVGHVEAKNVLLDIKYYAVALPIGVYRIVLTFHDNDPFQFMGVIKINIIIEEKAKGRKDRKKV